MRSLERKDNAFRGEKGASVAVELKFAETEADGTFEGYAAIFGKRDQGHDVILSGAFASSLRKTPPKRVKMLWQHDVWTPIGAWTELAEDERGLRAKGAFNLEVQRGREAWSLAKAGSLDGLSIGYRTIKDEVDRERGERKLIEVDLVEVSVVTFPMQPDALIDSIKAGILPTEREFEQFLTRDAGFSAQQAKAIIADGFKSLISERDAGRGDKSGVAILDALRTARAAARG